MRALAADVAAAVPLLEDAQRDAKAAGTALADVDGELARLDRVRTPAGAADVAAAVAAAGEAAARAAGRGARDRAGRGVDARRAGRRRRRRRTAPAVGRPGGAGAADGQRGRAGRRGRTPPRRSNARAMHALDGAAEASAAASGRLDAAQREVDAARTSGPGGQPAPTPAGRARLPGVHPTGDRTAPRCRTQPSPPRRPGRAGEPRSRRSRRPRRRWPPGSAPPGTSTARSTGHAPSVTRWPIGCPLWTPGSLAWWRRRCGPASRPRPTGRGRDLDAAGRRVRAAREAHRTATAQATRAQDQARRAVEGVRRGARSGWPSSVRRRPTATISPPPGAAWPIGPAPSRPGAVRTGRSWPARWTPHGPLRARWPTGSTRCSRTRRPSRTREGHRSGRGGRRGRGTRRVRSRPARRAAGPGRPADASGGPRTNATPRWPRRSPVTCGPTY